MAAGNRRLQWPAAGVTEQRVQHFMKLAAARDREKVLKHGPLRIGASSSWGMGSGLMPLPEGMDETDQDLTDDPAPCQGRPCGVRNRCGQIATGTVTAQHDGIGTLPGDGLECRPCIMETPRKNRLRGQAVIH